RPTRVLKSFQLTVSPRSTSAGAASLPRSARWSSGCGTGSGADDIGFHGSEVTGLSYHDTVNVLQGLPFAGRGPFARAEWFALLERAGARPWVALARDGDRALALPLVRAGGGFEVLTNWYAFTWRPLATDPAPEDLVERVAADLARRASRIVLDKLADEDGTASRLERAFRQAGWWVRRERCDVNH